jgi:REP element-mobilizing transposase RayT
MTNGLRKAFLDHIVTGASGQGIEISLINCWIDHVHCLIRLKTDQNIAEVIQLVRTETARWIRKNGLSDKRFAWSREFFAASVSEGNLEGARNYILSQERYHSSRTFHEEIEAYFAVKPPVPDPLETTGTVVA